jgi:hypothetical protein
MLRVMIGDVSPWAWGFGGIIVVEYFPQIAGKIISDYRLTLWARFGSIGVRL